MAKIKTTVTKLDTLHGFDLLHTTDNRKRPTNRYTLDVAGLVAASAHRIGEEGTFSVLLGDTKTNGCPARVLGIAPNREAAIAALRTIASKL